MSQKKKTEMYEPFRVGAGPIQMAGGHWGGSKRAVVCIHGLTSNHLSFGGLANFLQQNGVDTYGLDLRGRGQSDKPTAGPYGVETHRDDIRGTLEALGLKRPVLLGHSLGCYISILVAARYPELISGLILIDGGGVLSLGQKLKGLKAIRPSLDRLKLEFPDEQTYLDRMRAAPFIKEWTPELEKYFLSEIEEVNGKYRVNIPEVAVEGDLQSLGGSIRPLTMLFNAIFHPIRNLRLVKKVNNPPYSSIKSPTLILKAKDHNVVPGDDILPVSALQRMVREIPNVTAHTLSDVDHYKIVSVAHAERDRRIFDFLDALP